MTSAIVSALNLYPVKSCRGIALDSVRVGVRGLIAPLSPSGPSEYPVAAGDREWMIVDDGGRFVTQREHPRLALVGVAIDRAGLTLSARDRPPIAIPFEAPAGPAHDVVVWRSEVRAFDAGDAAAAWLSAHLDAKVRLVRFDRSRVRHCNPDYVGDTGANVAFADGYPILIIGEASLDDLNERLVNQGTGALPMNRFRPNIVLVGLEPYDEDHVDTITIGEVTLRMVKPCTRCTITTTDQDTASVGDEPLPTLAAYRLNEALGGVTFGMNAIVVGGEGATIALGAPAAVTFRFER